jgi:type IV pilus assembly protein PilA
VRQRGFSLIELLIVVAIILVIAAIAVPSLLRSRIAANEASAVQHIRTLNTAETTYATAFPNCGYQTLTELKNAGMLDDDLLANGAKSGYLFAVTPSGGSATCSPTATPNTSHKITADPASPTGGTRHFLSDSSGIIRYNVTAAAQPTDSPI